MDLSAYRDSLLGLIENSDFSVWLREADYAFASLVAIHLVGAGLVASISVALNLQLLGAAPGVSARAMNKYLPILWLGLAISVPSGLILVISYPTKELTNPLFYFKLLAIGLALIALRDSRELVKSGLGDKAAVVRVKRLAIASLALWAFVIGAGRFLAYTYSRLTLSF